MPRNDLPSAATHSIVPSAETIRNSFSYRSPAWIVSVKNSRTDVWSSGWRKAEKVSSLPCSSPRMSLNWLVDLIISSPKFRYQSPIFALSAARSRSAAGSLGDESCRTAASVRRAQTSNLPSFSEGIRFNSSGTFTLELARNSTKTREKLPLSAFLSAFVTAAEFVSEDCQNAVSEKTWDRSKRGSTFVFSNIEPAISIIRPLSSSKP